MTIKLAEVQIEASWKQVLANEFTAPYFAKLKQTLIGNKADGEKIYPPGSLIFNAFNQTPLEQVNIVIIGQDPYHGENQAMGLSFSVPTGTPIPPSLKNIYKELKNEYPDYQIPNHGDLTHWAQQGVLLLNASLTVLAGRAGSHSKIGWQQFTDAVIKTLSEQRENIVFMLWGNFAKTKAALINPNKHYILQANHPSPLAGGKFFGCNHFRLANDYLQTHKKQPVNWQII